MTRLVGYCVVCRHFRYVRSEGAQLAAGALSGVYEGICTDCERTQSGQDVERGRDRAARGE